MRVYVLIGIVLCSLLGGNAFAAPPKMQVLPGKCRALVIVGTDYTKFCQPIVALAQAGGHNSIITRLARGAGGFNFYLSGIGPGTVKLLAVEVSTYPHGDSYASHPVKGTCTIGRIGPQPAVISCAAKDTFGLSHRLEFVK
jgi:hypothetical protein